MILLLFSPTVWNSLLVMYILARCKQPSIKTRYICLTLRLTINLSCNVLHASGPEKPACGALQIGLLLCTRHIAVKNHADLLSIFVNPFAGDVVSFKQSWNPLDHFHFALTSQLSLFFLEQELLLRCCMLVRTHDGIAYSDPQPTRANENAPQLFTC